jgi:ribosomal protein S18 acetylase RimI-like enzyme
MFSLDPQEIGNPLISQLVPHEVPLIAATLASIDPWLTLNYHANDLQTYLTKEDAALMRWKIVHQNRIAGAVCVRQPWLRGPYIELLAIFPDFQNLGLGREVIDLLVTQAKKNSKNLWAVVSDFNASAQQFYRKNNFLEIGPLDDLVQPGNREILLRRIL